MFYYFVKPESQNPEVSNNHDPSLIEQLTDSERNKYSIDTIFSGLSQSLIIGGEGPANSLLGLWHNGRFSASAITFKNKYEFSPQSLYLGNNTFTVWSLAADGTTVHIDSFSVQYVSQRIQSLAIPLTTLNVNENILALTFDAGSAANGADSIIRILESKNVKLTFFLTGRFIRKFPHIVQNLVENNHELANHTLTHPHLTSYEENGAQNLCENVNRSFIFTQLNRTDSLMFAGFATHLKPYWRAPFGEYNKQILSWAAEAGYKHVGWSPGCDTRDWISDPESELYFTNEEIYEHLIDLESRGRLKGSIILMHLHSERKEDAAYKILAKLIDTLQKRNYRIVTISELIHASISL
jgi:peptidoglycan/xylan/chitin deacetylase (PgdA/CDA1 family)